MFLVNMLGLFFGKTKKTLQLQMLFIKPKMNLIENKTKYGSIIARSGSRASATSKMECFVIRVNGFQPLTNITKRSILDVAAGLDPPLIRANFTRDQ